jgi:hypothetical protein
MAQNLTWEELADIYQSETGGRARIQPMDKIFAWAESRGDLFVLHADGTLSLKEPQHKAYCSFVTRAIADEKVCDCGADTKEKE